jgi:hypothetical protein
MNAMNIMSTTTNVKLKVMMGFWRWENVKETI